MPLTRLAVLVAAPILALATTLSPGGASPIDDARLERDRAQAAATAAAQRYVDALSEQARQEAEIARLEREIPILRARAVELRQQLRQRAVVMYKEQSSAMPLTRVLEAENVVDAARALQLTSGAASHDRDAAVELTRTAVKLEQDEVDLRARKVEQDRIVERLTTERALLDAALADASVALGRIQAVAAAQAGFGGPDERAAGRVLTGASVCPIAGPVAFTNDWGAPRSGGRTHQGNDLFAPYGTPDVAVIAGWIQRNLDDLGGLGIFLHGNDGNVYYYAHLSRLEGPDRRVTRGEVIGYVGDTGNAKGGPPHTHFEIRPGGGPAVNPYPTLRVLCPQ